VIARLLSRRAARHAVIALATAGAVAALYSLVPSPNAARRLTLATAYAGLALLAATLWLGPWYVLRGRRAPVSVGWRRDLGIWAAFVAALHTIVGLRVHFRGDWRRYFLFPPRDGAGPRPRTDGMGWANHAGLLALLVMLVLLAISNDFALRRLGPARWKAIQRWNYVGFVLVGLHAIVYQVMVRRTPPVVAVVIAVLVLTAAVQIAGFRLRRAGRGAGTG
jgi:sulfoxide reductase heme-binding subunit YedZ